MDLRTERTLLHCQELIETLLEEAQDNYDYATDTGGSAYVDLCFHTPDMRDALREIKYVLERKESA